MYHNTSINTNLTTNVATNDAGWIGFWCSVVLCLIAGFISILGNGLVLYVSNSTNDVGKFKYLNLVVKHLAISDFLFGLIGTPFTILFWHMGKYHSLHGGLQAG